MLTVKEAAERLHVSPSLLYALCSRRAIAHERFGLGRGAIRISEEALAEFQERCRVRGSAAAALPARVTPPRPPPTLRHVKLRSGGF
jgi:excisionase family DNA binding protein